MRINRGSLIGLIGALFMLFMMGPIANGQEVYGIQNNGMLSWYRHLGQGDGTFRWQGPNQVGTGWQVLKSVFAVSPSSKAYSYLAPWERSCNMRPSDLPKLIRGGFFWQRNFKRVFW